MEETLRLIHIKARSLNLPQLNLHKDCFYKQYKSQIIQLRAQSCFVSMLDGGMQTSGSNRNMRSRYQWNLQKARHHPAYPTGPIHNGNKCNITLFTNCSLYLLLFNSSILQVLQKNDYPIFERSTQLYHHSPHTS